MAVHPDDERYRHLIGATCLVPMLKRPIPVIHDTYVDMAFGTGALKITPGHDPNDFEIGQRHGLPIISVLDTDAQGERRGRAVRRAGSLRVPQEAVGRHGGRRADDQDRAVP